LLLAVVAIQPVRPETDSATGGPGPFAYVTVAGAPGDGDQALAAALGRQLEAHGLKVATAFQANIYEVQGTVRVTPAAKGKETIVIVWVVLGPDGNQLGITRQTKDVRKGSLGKEGKAADAAAGAAAQDIAKLALEVASSVLSPEFEPSATASASRRASGEACAAEQEVFRGHRSSTSTAC
jgi:hypothetical protein